jgi:hypothetical protein
LLDSYSRRARLAPVLIAMLPAVALAVGGAFAAQYVARLVALVVGAAGVVLCALVRDAGRRAQTRLWQEWDGSPTLRRLRFRGSNSPDRVSRLHARLDAQLPTAAEEAADRDAADERYDEAVADLRQLTRAGEAYQVLASENADYGFRRNLYGIRPFALVVAATSGLVALVILLISSGTLEQRGLRWGPGLLIAVASMVLHWRVVSSAWVRLAGERYADRLFEAARSVGSG